MCLCVLVVDELAICVVFVVVRCCLFGVVCLMFVACCRLLNDVDCCVLLVAC